MTLRPLTSVALYSQDHPALALRLMGKLREREKELANEISSGLAQDWGDYKSRVGYLRGLREAIAVCEETQKELTR